MPTDPPQARLAEGGPAGPRAQEATNGPRTGGRRLDQSERKVNGRRGDASVVAAPGKLGKRRHTPLPARAHLEALRGRALRATHRLAGM